MQAHSRIDATGFIGGKSAPKALVVHAQVDVAALEGLGYVVASSSLSHLVFDEGVRLLVWSNELSLTDDIVALFPNLLAIISWGTDDAHVKCRRYLEQSGIRHYSVDSYSTTAVAEFIVMSMLSMARSFPNIIKGERPYGSEISGRRIGIIGMGKIGRRVARILGEGFGCDIHYHSRNDKELTNYTYHHDAYSLFNGCEFIIVTVKGSSFVIDPDLVPDGGRAYLINVTGERVLSIDNTQNLIGDGRLSGALYDVECRAPCHTRSDDRLTVTPKVAYRTNEANRNRQKLLQSYAEEVLREL